LSTQAADASVRSAIVVEAPLDRAFSVFTEGIGSWFPREYNLLDIDIGERVFEPHVGGRILDRGTDGSECVWGPRAHLQLPDRVVFSWDISPRWHIETDPEKASEVEVRRIAPAPQRFGDPIPA
jgi:hypothetical protein